MTTKYLTGAYPSGYTVASGVSYLDIESTASIGGTGVIDPITASHPLQITNNGTVHATSGNATGISIYYKAGNSITNGNSNASALVEGDYMGIYAVHATVTNYGTIEGLGSGIHCAYTTVTNFGTIEGLGGSYRYRGVILGPGSAITNGSSTDTHALIEGYLGIIGTGSVSNFGSIIGTEAGVYFSSPASSSVTVTNGSQSDRAATIQGGRQGVLLRRNPTATVTNWGTISTGGYDCAGFFDGGLINNFGAISSTGASGVGITLTGSVRVVNGSAQDTAASITGVAFGIYGHAYTPNTPIPPETVVNYGTVQATGIGVLLRGDHAAIVNYGTMIGGVGVYLIGKHDVLINGSSTNAAALIGGGGSRVVGAGDTVVNFGTISGLSLTKASDVLKVEAGSAFGSPVQDAGALSLVNGVGTLSGLTGGSVTVSGSMAAATFSGFGTLEIGKSARFTVTGSAMIAAGQTLNDAGVLTVAGSLVVAGAIVGSGVVGLAAHASAEFDTAVPAALTVSFQASGSVLDLKDPAAFAATIGGFNRQGKIDLIGVTATAAVLGAGDKLAITNSGATIATLQLSGAFGSDTFATSSDGSGGTFITVTRAAATVPPASATPPPHALIAAAAGLGARFVGAYALPTVHPSYGRLTLAGPRAQIA